MSNQGPIVGEPVDLKKLAATAAAQASAAADYAEAARDYASNVSGLTREVRALRGVLEAQAKRARWWRLLLILVAATVLISALAFIRVHNYGVASCETINDNRAIIRSILVDSLETSERLEGSQDPGQAEERQAFFDRSVAKLEPVDCPAFLP